MRIRRGNAAADDVQAAAPFVPTDPVPDGFPFEVDDEQLDAVLRSMLAAIPGFGEYRAILPELKLALILVGAQERARRDSDRFARVSLYVAGMAVVIALVSLIVSIVLASAR